MNEKVMLVSVMISLGGALAWYIIEQFRIPEDYIKGMNASMESDKRWVQQMKLDIANARLKSKREKHEFCESWGDKK